VHVTGRLADGGQAVQRFAQLRAQQIDIDTGLGQQM
jgi:hypothetical protein